MKSAIPNNEFETPRLTVKALSIRELHMYIRNDQSLETSLDLRPSTRMISPELEEALDITIIPAVIAAGENYLFSTLWTVIAKKENTMIGDICILGNPNENGEIEIGYGVYPEFRGNGFMKEAVGGLIQWAGAQPSVRFVLASTAKTNVASFAILEKNLFDNIGENETDFHWRRTLRPAGVK